METPHDWTEQEWKLYLGLRYTLRILLKRLESLSPESRELHQAMVGSALTKLDDWREILVGHYQQASRDSYQLRRTRDALMQTVVAMLGTANENGADFLEPHGHNVIHLLKEGMIFPEHVSYEASDECPSP